MGSLHSQTSFCCCSCRYLFVFFVLIASLLEGRLVGAEPPLTHISYDLYHSSDTLLNEVRTLADRHPDKLTMETMKAGEPDYLAEIEVITYNQFPRAVNASTFRVLLSFGQHGRELITSEVALRLLSILSEETKMPGFILDQVLHDLIIKIVPMENVKGRKLVESGELCERRNGRGVDLNRNWNVDWGKKEKDYDPSEENPGSSPFSEPESKIMQKLAHSFGPHVWVNVHSGMEGLFMPYDHNKSTPGGSELQAMMSVLEEVNRRHCHDRCVVGSGGGSVGYLAHGTSTDYMYEVLRVPISFTFEIYGDSEASPMDCFRMFNPVDPATFSRVVDDWAAAFLLVFEIARNRLEEAAIAADYGGGGAALMGGRETAEPLELGLQELKSYYLLFVMSSGLLLFIFCSRISRGNRSRQMNFSSQV